MHSPGRLVLVARSTVPCVGCVHAGAAASSTLFFASAAAAASSRRSFSSTSSSLAPARIAVVGSGPGGFYTAKYLLKDDPEVTVDVIDRLPTPYGACMTRAESCTHSFQDLAQRVVASFVNSRGIKEAVAFATRMNV